MARTSWLGKQMKKNSQEVDKWPQWMKDAAIQLDSPYVEKIPHKHNSKVIEEKEKAQAAA